MTSLRNRLASWWKALSRGESELGKQFDPEDPDNWLSLDYVHDQVTAQLQAQSDTWDVIDGRLRFLLGIVGIVFAAVLGLQRGTSPIPFLVGAFAIAAAVVFFAAALIAARGYWLTVFDRPPQLAFLREEFLTTDPRETKREVIDTIIEAYNKNQIVLNRKMALFGLAFVLTVLATGLLLLAIIAQVASQTLAGGQ